MAEREFDWPKEMPDGFWTSGCGVTPWDLFSVRGDWVLRRDLGGDVWWASKRGGPGLGVCFHERDGFMQEAYTALREHVLREREERAAGAAHLQACEDHWDEVFKARLPIPEREERPWKSCEYNLTASKLHDSLDWLADRQDLHGVAGIDLVGLVSDLRKRLERLEATND